MSFEIVYTSSLRGLSGGNRGFCTVAATTGIPRLLQEKLESLSGYRHLHAPGSKRNPVNFCCQTIRIQKETYVVLSRVADAGTDFSGRSNKIAHHLALSLNEVRSMQSPPTALLADSEFWYTQWSGEPEWLPPNRMPTHNSYRDAPCNTWKKMLGDAGWAGVAARSVVNGHETVSVILPEGCNALGLVSEAMQLLPPRAYWKVGFSTYFTRTSGEECHWRFLWEGMEEATAVRDRPAGIVIDSKSRIARQNEDAYVAAARSGDFKSLPGRSPSGDSEAAESSEGRPMTQSQQRRRQAGERARQARLAAKARPGSRREREVVPESQSPVPSSGHLRKWWIIAGTVSAVVVCLFIVWLIAFR